MFEELKKVDMVALRLEEARSNDLTPKVSAFLKTLLDLDKRERAPKAGKGESATEGGGAAGTDALQEGGAGDGQGGAGGRGEDEEKEERPQEELKGDRKFDYYATKMALQAASVKRDVFFSLPGTPEEVNLKLVGDQTIKSITMPRVFLHFCDGDDGEKEGVGEEVHRGSFFDVPFRHKAPNILTL